MTESSSTVSSLKELQKLLQKARTLHGNLSDQLVNTLGLDPVDVKARYGHFSDADGSTAQRRLRHRYPEAMTQLPITSAEKRKMRLLLRSLRTATTTSIEDTSTSLQNSNNKKKKEQEAAEAGDEDEEAEEEEEEEETESNKVTLGDLRGTSRHSFALFDKLALRSSDVADLTSSSSDDDAYDESDEEEGDDEEETETTDEMNETSSTSTTNNNTKSRHRSIEAQTQESSIQTIKLAERLLSGTSEGCHGGMKSRRFPHWIPQPPSSSSLIAHLRNLSNNNNNNNNGNTIIGSSSLSRQSVFAGQSYLAMVFRPQSMKMLQLTAAQQQSDDNNSTDNSSMIGDEEGPGGWTPTFFPVEVQFIPRNQQQQDTAHAAATNNRAAATTQQQQQQSQQQQQQSQHQNKSSNNNSSNQQQQKTGTGTGTSSSGGMTNAASNVDQEGGARLVIRRIPVTRDGQRFALSRADAAGAVVTDVGCSALRSVTVGQTSRYFLRGRMVLQKKSRWASRWSWKVPASYQQQTTQPQQQSQQSQQQQQQQQKIPSSVDFTSIPSMAQMSDRSVALSFVDATVLNFPAKTTDVEEDTALQAAATRNLNQNLGDSANNNNNDLDQSSSSTLPQHVNTNPANFLPTAGAELALVFPSHAEFNTFLAESMHWCADYSAFRYGRPADFHSYDVLKNLSPQVRDVWQSLDSEELTFCEEFHIPPSVYLTAKRRVTASADPSKSMTSVDSLLCEEDLSVICDVDYLQLSAMIRFLQARGFVKLHSLYHVKKAF